MRRSLPRFSPVKGPSPRRERSAERSPLPRKHQPVSVEIEGAFLPCEAASILDPQFLESMEAPRASTQPIRHQRKSLASFVTQKKAPQRRIQPVSSPGSSSALSPVSQSTNASHEKRLKASVRATNDVYQ